MTEGTALAVKDEHQLDGATLLSVVSSGDCTGLTPERKVMYYKARCEAAGLDYRAQPFQFIPLNGKLVLYATKAATDQLASKHGVKVEVVSQVTENGIRTVTVRALAKDGRQTDEIGCVSVGNASGDQLCNIYMKAVTKAKRRAILSICGLGMLDETELETIPQVDAPPALPLPPRRSEKVKKDSNGAPPVIDAPQGNVESANAGLDMAAGGEAPRPEVEVGEDGAVWGHFLIKDVKTKSGKNTRGPWTTFGAVIDHAGAEIIVSTFSETLGATLQDLKGKEAEMGFKPDGKGHWNLEFVEPPKF